MRPAGQMGLMAAVLWACCSQALGIGIITNDLRLVTGQVTPVAINVRGPDAPQQLANGQVVYGRQFMWPVTNGFLWLPLHQGNYLVELFGGGMLQVVMPLESGTNDVYYSLSQVATNLQTFTYTNQFGLISSRVIPGAGLLWHTNNPGTTVESLSIQLGAIPGLASLQVSSNTFPPVGAAFTNIGPCGCLSWLSNTTLYFVCTNPITGTASTNLIFTMGAGQ